MVRDFLKNGRLLFTRRQTNILSAAFVIAVAYLTSGLLGLLRNRLLAATFFGGRERELDIYFAAFVIPDTLFQLMVIGALSAAFIPVFSHYLREGEREASELASSTMNALTAVFLLLVAIVFLASPSLAQLLAPSLGSEDKLLLAQLLRIIVVAQIFFALSGFLTAIIQAHQRFLIPAFAPLVYNLGIIAGIVILTPSQGIFGAAYGVVAGALLHFLIQVPLALKLGFHYRPILNLHHPGVQRIRALMPLRSLTLAIGQAERFVAVSIATSLAAGSLTIFNFARQLYLLPVTLFGTTIGQAAFPTLSAEIAAQKKQEFQDTLRSAIHQVLYLSLPAAAILLVLRVPAVRLVFGAKNFPWAATLLTGKTVAFLALAIPTQSLLGVFSRAFYALHDTKTPFLTTTLSAAVTVSLSIVLAQTLGFGVIGIAAAVALSTAIHAILLALLLERKVPFLNSQLIFPILKMGLATLTTGVFLWAPMRVLDRFILDTTRTVNLLLLTMSALAIGLVVYLNLSAVLRIEQLSEIVALGKRIGNWRKALEESEEVLESTNLDKPAG